MTEGEYLDFGQEGNNTKSSTTTMIDVESISYDNFPDPDDIANSKCDTKLLPSFLNLDYYTLDIYELWYETSFYGKYILPFC